MKPNGDRTIDAVEARLTDTAQGWMTEIVLVVTSAGLVTIFSKISFRTELRTPVPSISRFTFADTVDRVAGGAIVTVTVVDTARTKPPSWTGSTTVWTCPSSRTPTRARHVVTFSAVTTRAPAHASPSVGSYRTGLATQRSSEPWGALACPTSVVARTVT